MKHCTYRHARNNRKKCKGMQNIQDFKKKNTDLQVFYKEGQKQKNNIEIKKQKEHLKDPRTV